ncbi:MAG: SPASM domain-containing protein [archaeon]
MFFYSNIIKNKIFPNSRFSRVEIETHNFCNNECHFCPNKLSNENINFMSTKLFKKIILELKEINYKGIISPHFYNNPLYDNRFFSFLDFIEEELNKSKIEVYLNSNSLKEKNVKRILKYKTVSTLIISDYKLVNLKKIKRFIRSLPLKLKRKIVYKNINENSMLHNIGSFKSSQNTFSFSRCQLPINYLTINHKGEVLLCCNDYNSNHVFGNINETKITKIWDSKEYSKIRKEIFKGNIKFKMCKSCSKQGKEKTIYNPIYLEDVINSKEI